MIFLDIDDAIHKILIPTWRISTKCITDIGALRFPHISTLVVPILYCMQKHGILMWYQYLDPHISIVYWLTMVNPTKDTTGCCFYMTISRGIPSGGLHPSTVLLVQVIWLQTATDIL